MYASGNGGWSNKHIWLKYEIWTLFLSLASVAHVAMPVVAPADAVKEDVNELLSHVGWCLWGSSQDSLHVLSLFAVWRLWCAAWLQRVACGQTGGDQLSTGGPCCGPTLSPAEQRLGSACKCLCVCFFVWDACLPVCRCVCQQEARVNTCNMHIKSLEALLCPRLLLISVTKRRSITREKPTHVCVCDCVGVFVFVRKTEPFCPLLSPAICHCCTLGSVRMVWAPAVPPVTPSPEAHCRSSHPTPRPSLN